MQALITSYLIQKKECDLPLLGHFRIKTKPADFVKANKQIFPPADEILYSEFAGKLSGDLLAYIAARERITPMEAEEKINSWCNDARQKIELGEKVMFDSLGSLQKDAVGNIFFQRKKGYGFYEPITAERVQREDGHVLSTRDTEASSLVANNFYADGSRNREWWKVWAIVLLAISIIILAFHFYMHGFSGIAIGNKASFSTQQPPASYHAP